MKLVLYLTTTLLAVCAAVQAVRGRSASAILLAGAALITLRTLQRSRERP
jgi:hypothetical protein